MAETKTEYAVKIKDSGSILPVSKESGERYASQWVDQLDSSRFELMTRTITVGDWEKYNG